MSKASRDLIDSMTPENRNLLLLLQMRTGVYIDGEATICKQVNVIRHAGVEYLCPVNNSAIEMDMRPFILNVDGQIVLSIVRVKLDHTSEYVGMLDILVGGAELREGMRRASVERKRVPTTRLTGASCITQPKAHPTGMGRIPANRIHGETEVSDRFGQGPLQVNPEVLATIEAYANPESRSASAALMMNKAPLGQSEYFNRKALLGAHIKPTWGQILETKWLLFKISVRQRIRSVKRFFISLFNR